MSHMSSEVNPRAEVQISEGRQEPYPLSPLTSGAGTEGDESSHPEPAGAEGGQQACSPGGAKAEGTGGGKIQDSTSLLQERLLAEVIRPLLQEVNDSHLLTENRLHAVKGKIADIVNRLYLGSSNYRPIGADSSYATPLLPTTTAATTAPAHAATAVVHAAAATAQTAAAQAIAAVKGQHPQQLKQQQQQQHKQQLQYKRQQQQRIEHQWCIWQPTRWQ